jgi:hypothetical protein
MAVMDSVLTMVYIALGAALYRWAGIPGVIGAVVGIIAYNIFFYLSL